MTTRDAILDGALEVMRTRGLAHTTTKEIARASGFSEATLYKLFADKAELFMCVLMERLPRITVVSGGVDGLVGTGTVTGNLTTMVMEIERFYEASLPIAMSLFSDITLLGRHREALRARGAGPETIVRYVAGYLRGEQSAGRISRAPSADGAAMSLVGACMHRAFLRRYHDQSQSEDDLARFADGVVTAAMHGLAVSSGDGGDAAGGGAADDVPAEQVGGGEQAAFGGPGQEDLPGRPGIQDLAVDDRAGR
jgi:AcrR family transcriptional regulator